MKKNLVYVGIFAVVMFFAGLTSAYYVNMGGGFWLKYPMPLGFYLSTLFIACSSLCYILAIRFIKQGKINAMKLQMALTLVFGLLFVSFQFISLIVAVVYFTLTILLCCSILYTVLVECSNCPKRQKHHVQFVDFVFHFGEDFCFRLCGSPREKQTRLAHC